MLHYLTNPANLPWIIVAVLLVGGVLGNLVGFANGWSRADNGEAAKLRRKNGELEGKLRGAEVAAMNSQRVAEEMESALHELQDRTTAEWQLWAHKHLIALVKPEGIEAISCGYLVTEMEAILNGERVALRGCELYSGDGELIARMPDEVIRALADHDEPEKMEVGRLKDAGDAQDERLLAEADDEVL